MKKRFWWPTLKEDVRIFCSLCTQCQLSKGHRKKTAPVVNMKVPSRPWESVAIDLLTGLPRVPGYLFQRTAEDEPKSRKAQTDCEFPTGEYSVAITAVFRLTGFTVLIPCSSTVTGEQMASLFIQHTVPFFGIPSSFFSDRDTRITGSFWRGIN